VAGDFNDPANLKRENMTENYEVRTSDAVEFIERCTVQISTRNA